MHLADASVEGCNLWPLALHFEASDRHDHALAGDCGDTKCCHHVPTPSLYFVVRTFQRIRSWACLALSSPRKSASFTAPPVSIPMLDVEAKRPIIDLLESIETDLMFLYGMDTTASLFPTKLLSCRITRMLVMPTKPVPTPMQSYTA